MVCFSIQIFVPQQEKESNNSVLDRRVKQICKYMNAKIYQEQEKGDLKFYEVRLCDTDAVGLLRDLPTPFAVGRIDILHVNTNLYLHRNHHPPPRIPLLKDIYWLAKSTERWNLPISHDQ